MPGEEEQHSNSGPALSGGIHVHIAPGRLAQLQGRACCGPLLARLPF